MRGSGPNLCRPEPGGKDLPGAVAPGKVVIEENPTALWCLGTPSRSRMATGTSSSASATRTILSASTRGLSYERLAQVLVG